MLWLLLGNPLDPLGRRSLGSLLQVRPAQALRVVGGLAFDSAGGLLWAAPLAMAALLGLGVLARRGGAGERALLAGGALTVAALLHLQEWRGGDSPPVRYLVPMLPLVALAGAMLLREPRRWRPLLWVAVPPTLLVTWVAITRPFLLINPGSGGFWLGNVIARRSWRGRPRPVPLVPPAVRRDVDGTGRRPHRDGRWWCCSPGSGLRAPVCFRRAGVGLWLVAAGSLLATLMLRPDAVVEIEDPQVRHLGGDAGSPSGDVLAVSRSPTAGGSQTARPSRCPILPRPRRGDAPHQPGRWPSRRGCPTPRVLVRPTDDAAAVDLPVSAR